MRQFRLVGSERSMIVIAHSSLDAGARIKSDPDFYYVGEIVHIEDMGGVVVARVTSKGRIVAISKRAEKQEKVRKEKPIKEGKHRRERIIKKVFDW